MSTFSSRLRTVSAAPTFRRTTLSTHILKNSRPSIPSKSSTSGVSTQAKALALGNSEVLVLIFIPVSFLILLKDSLDLRQKTNRSFFFSDSGSPVSIIQNGRSYVIGHNSFGETKTRNGTRMFCYGTSGFCRLSFERSFIEKYVNKKDYCLI